jgi:hypothetical protein
MSRPGSFDPQVSDSELARRNRIERDRLVAEDARRRARGIRVIDVDGRDDARAVADLVADQSVPFLKF